MICRRFARIFQLTPLKSVLSKRHKAKLYLKFFLPPELQDCHLLRNHRFHNLRQGFYWIKLGGTTVCQPCLVLSKFSFSTTLWSKIEVTVEIRAFFRGQFSERSQDPKGPQTQFFKIGRSRTGQGTKKILGPLGSQLFMKKFI